MLIYKRYIIKSIIPSLLVIVFSITTLVWITQVLKLLYLIDKGVQVGHFLSLIILVLPYLLFTLLPFATVISIIYIYSYLSEGRQLIILQNSGLSNIQLASPALLIAFSVTLFAYYISSILLPVSYSKLKEDLYFMRNNYATNIVSEKTFTQISKGITVYFDEKMLDGRLKGLVMFDNRMVNNPKILFANVGIFKINESQPTLRLLNGVRQEYDTNGNITNLLFESLTVKLVDHNVERLTQNESNKEINEYYIKELLHPSKQLTTQRRIKLIAEGHQRIIWPMYNLVLAALALAIFLYQPYNKQSNFKQILLTAVAVSVITYLHFALQNLASRDLNFVFVCYANVIFVMILSGYLFFSTNSRI